MSTNSPAAEPTSGLADERVKTIVVTGGTAGLGLEALKQLVAREGEAYHILIGCRKDPTSSNTTGALKEDAEALRKHCHSPQTSIEYLPLDLSSSESIDAFTQQVKDRIKSTSTNIDVLFLCGGAVASKFEAIKLPGINGKEVERTLFVNTLSHVILVRQLLPFVAPDGRVSIVNSGMHLRAARKSPVTPKTIDAALSPASNWPGGFVSYTISKLIAIHFSFILNDKLRSEGSDITVITSHPGFVPATELARGAPYIFQLIMKYIMPWFPFSTSLQAGGAILVRSMIDRDLASTTYITPKGVENVATECYSAEIRAGWASWLKEIGVWP